MKKQIVWVLVVTMVFAMGMVALAQPGGGGMGGMGGGMARGGRGNMQVRREAQTRAIEAIEQAIARIKEGMVAPGQRGGQRGGFQDMSAEDMENLRNQMMQRRQEQQDAIATIQSQVVMLKERQQLQTEHTESLGQLRTLEAQAKRENATQTAAMIAKMIQDKQTQYDQLLEKLGYGQN